jgi:GntR family transcriptional regulator
MTTPRWSVVASALRSDIRAGRLGPSGELDTEAELCRRFDTSRITVRRALTELRREGLVVSQRGSGSRAVLDTSTDPSFTIMRGASIGTEANVVRTNCHWRTLRPNAELVNAIRRAGVRKPERTPWLRFTYEQRLNGSVFDDASVWFAPTIAGLVDRTAHRDGHTAALLANTGVRFGTSIQTVSAAWNAQRATSGAPSDSVDLVLERVMLDPDGDVAFVSIHHHHGAMTSIRVDLPTTNLLGRDQFTIAPLRNEL